MTSAGTMKHGEEEDKEVEEVDEVEEETAWRRQRDQYALPHPNEMMVEHC